MTRPAAVVVTLLLVLGLAVPMVHAGVCSATACTPTTLCSTACTVLDDPGPPPVYLPSTCGDEGYPCAASACSPYGSNATATIDCKIGQREWSGCSPALSAPPAVMTVYTSGDGRYRDCNEGRVVWSANAARAIAKESGGGATGIWGKWTGQPAVRDAVGYPVGDTQPGGTKQQFRYGHLVLSGTVASGTAYIAGGRSMPEVERAALLALSPTAPTIAPSDTSSTPSGGGGWGFGAIGSSSKPIWVVKDGASQAFKVGGTSANPIVDRWNAHANVSGPLGWPTSSTVPLTGDGTLATGSAGIACGQNWGSGPGYYSQFAGGAIYLKGGAPTAYTVPPGTIGERWLQGIYRNEQSCGEAGPLGWPSSNQTNAFNTSYPKAQQFQRGELKTWLVATNATTVIEMYPNVYDYWMSVTGGPGGWLGTPLADWSLANPQAGQPFERGTVFSSTDPNVVFGVEGEPRSACLTKYLALGGAINSALGNPLGNSGFEGTNVYPQSGTLRKQVFANGYLTALSPTRCVGSYAPLTGISDLRVRRGVFDRSNPAASEVVHVPPNEPAPWAAARNLPLRSREHRYFPSVVLEFTPVVAPITTLERSSRGAGAGANWAPIRVYTDSELEPGAPFTFTESWATVAPGADNDLAFPGENCYRLTVRGTNGLGGNVFFRSNSACVATRPPVTNNSPQFTGSMAVQPLKRMQIRLWGYAGTPGSSLPTFPWEHKRSWLRVELQHRPEGLGHDDLAGHFPVGNATVFSPWYAAEAGDAGLAFDLKLDSPHSAADYIEDFRDVTRLKLSVPEADRADDHCPIQTGCAGTDIPFCVKKIQLISNEIRAAGACSEGSATCLQAVSGYGAVRTGEVFFERDYGDICEWVGATDGPADTSSSVIEIPYQDLHGDWARRHPAAEPPANTQPTQGGAVRRWFAPYGAAGIHAGMLREQIEALFADGVFQGGTAGTPSHHDHSRYMDGVSPVTQYWVDTHTTIFKVDITDQGGGVCGGSAHAHVYLTLHTDGSTGTSDAPGVISVDTDASASSDFCGNALASLIHKLTFVMSTFLPGPGGPLDLVAVEAEKIRMQVDALAEDRQAPASPIPLKLLFCCNGNIEVNCCSGDNSECANRPTVDYGYVQGPGYNMDPHLPSPSTDLPLLCSELPQ